MAKITNATQAVAELNRLAKLRAEKTNLEKQAQSVQAELLAYFAKRQGQTLEFTDEGGRKRKAHPQEMTRPQADCKALLAIAPDVYEQVVKELKIEFVLITK